MSEINVINIINWVYISFSVKKAHLPGGLEHPLREGGNLGALPNDVYKLYISLMCFQPSIDSPINNYCTATIKGVNRFVFP